MEWLHVRLLEEFDRLRKSGIKCSPNLLVSAAQHLLMVSDHHEFTANYIAPGLLCLQERNTPRWVQTFQDRFNIVQRRQVGKKMVSPQKQAFIEKEVAYYLGKLERGFESGLCLNAHMENIDETHFVIYMDDGHTLDYKGTEDIRYAEVVSGTTGMTMVVHITGSTSSRIGVPIKCFTTMHAII